MPKPKSGPALPKQSIFDLHREFQALRQSDKGVTWDFVVKRPGGTART